MSSRSSESNRCSYKRISKCAQIDFSRNRRWDLPVIAAWLVVKFSGAAATASKRGRTHAAASCAASTGVVLVVELVEGGVHTQRRSSLIPNDGSVGHAGHAQRDELRFVVQSFGELVDAQLAGGGPS